MPKFVAHKARTWRQRLGMALYYSGLVSFIGAVAGYFLSSSAYIPYTGIRWTVSTGVTLATIFVGAFLKPTRLHSNTLRSLLSVLALSFILVNTCLLSDVDINIYALTVGLCFSSVVFWLAWRQRRRYLN